MDVNALRYWSRIVNMISVRNQWLIERAPAPRWAERRPLCIPILHKSTCMHASMYACQARVCTQIDNSEHMITSSLMMKTSRRYDWTQQSGLKIRWGAEIERGCVCGQHCFASAQQPSSWCLTSLLLSEQWAVSSPYWWQINVLSYHQAGFFISPHKVVQKLKQAKRLHSKAVTYNFPKYVFQRSFQGLN